MLRLVFSSLEFVGICKMAIGTIQKGSERGRSFGTNHEEQGKNDERARR